MSTLMEAMRDIRVLLNVVERNGKPITLKQAHDLWGNSAWESLIVRNYVNWTSEAVTVTMSGSE